MGNSKDMILVAIEKGYSIDKFGEVISPKGVTLKGDLNKTKRLFKIKHNGSVIGIYHHRFQGFMKFGDKIFEKGVFVLNKNGNKTDNSYDNIIIGNQSDARMLMSDEARKESALNATAKVRKYDKEEVRKYYTENGNSYKKTMTHFGISSKGTLSFILNK